MLNIIKPNIKKVVLTVILSILTFITFLMVRNSSINNKVILDFKDEVVIDEIYLNDSKFIPNYDLSNYLVEDKYLFKEEKIEFNITNNDSIYISFDKKYLDNVSIYYNDKELEKNTSNDLVVINYSNSFKNVLISSFKNTKLLLKTFYLFLSLIINYLVLSFMKLGVSYIKDKKENTGLFIILIGLFILYYFNYYSLLNINKILIPFFVLVVLISLFKFTYNFKITKNNILSIFKLGLAVISVSYLFIVPPLNIPDEGKHFANSYSRLFYLEKDPTVFDEKGNQTGTKLFSKNVVKLYVRGAEYEMDTSHKINSISYFEDMGNKINKNDLASNEIIYGTHDASKFAYIPSNIIIWVCKLLNTPVLLMFLLARFINFLIYFLLILLALKIIPKYKYIFMFVIALPVCIHQSIGINQDWINNSLFFLYIAYIFRFIYEDRQFTKKDFIILLLIALGIINSKMVYTPAILLIFLAKNSNFKKPWITKIALTLLIVVLTGISYIGIENILHPKVVEVVSESNKYTISYLLHNPMQYIKILLNTFKESVIVHTIYGLYTGFGVSKAWLVSFSTYLNYLFILFILTVPYEKDNMKNKVGYLIVASMLYVLVLTALLTGWTELGSTVVLGLQPRYFIPTVLLGYMFVNNKVLKLDIKKYELFFTIIIIFFNILGIFTMLRGLYI